jgi:predicted secreted Zn-dependent protease
MPLQFRPAGEVSAVTGQRLDERTLLEVAQRASTEIAAASYETSFTYKTNAGRIASVDLTMTLRIEMPVWQNYGSRPKAEKDEWDRFYRALLHHEQGHIALYKREARMMLTHMSNASAQTIQAVHDREVARINQLSDAYDRQTDHGRRQNTPHGTTVISVP